MRYAVISASADATYAFPLPLVVALWEAHGLKPLVILAGDWSGAKPSLTVDMLTFVGCRIETVEMSGLWGAECWGKWLRMIACQIPGIADDDYLVTSDADMAVLDANNFLGQIDESKAFHVSYSNAYVGKPGETDVFPTCHLGATARIWRTITNPASTDITTACRAHLDRYGKAGMRRHGTLRYFSDEWILGEMLRAWPDYPQAAQFMSREQPRPEFPSRRIQRDCQPVDRAIDFHLPRPCWTTEAWGAVQRFCFPLLSEDRQRQLNEYRELWIS